ncbi:hypothetical protein GCM10010500_61200 [Streptomyces nigrescens]|nr:hypothetical protein GCM10010500_61200 [Streptomyces libani subsp. libani]
MISVPGAAAAVAVARIEAVMEAVVFGFMTRMRMTLQRFGGFHRMDSRFRAAERSYGHWHRQEIAARCRPSGSLHGTKQA